MPVEIAVLLTHRIQGRERSLQDPRSEQPFGASQELGSGQDLVPVELAVRPAEEFHGFQLGGGDRILGQKPAGGFALHLLEPTLGCDGPFESIDFARELVGQPALTGRLDAAQRRQPVALSVGDLEVRAVGVGKQG